MLCYDWINHFIEYWIKQPDASCQKLENKLFVSSNDKYLNDEKNYRSIFYIVHTVHILTINISTNRCI